MEMKTLSSQPTTTYDNPVRNGAENDEYNKWEEYDSSSCSHYRVSRSPTLSTIIEVPEPEEDHEPEEAPEPAPEAAAAPEPEDITPTYVVAEPSQNGNAPLVGEDVEAYRCCGAIRRRVSHRTCYALIAGSFLLMLASITALIYFLLK